MNTGTSAAEGRIDRVDLIATGASALLLNLAGPPGVGLLVFPALIPLLLRWAHRRRTGSLLWSMRYGALFFGLFWAIELLWVLRILRVGAFWPLPAWLGQVATLAVIGALFGALLHAGRRLPLFVTAPFAWAAVEVARADLLGPLNFAWHPLALPLTGWPLLIQPAAWVGETGLGVGVVMIAALIAAGMYRSTGWLDADSGGRDPGMSGGPWTRWGLAGAILVGWVVMASMRMNGVETRPVAAFVVVQPAIPLADRRDPDRSVTAAREAIEPLLDAAIRAGAGEILLPETALPLDLDGDSARAIVNGWAERTGRPIWVGGFTAADGGGLHNAIVRFDRAGEATGRWEKVALVPGVEWGPGNEYRRGPAEQALISYSAGSAGDGARSEPPVALICIESTRSERVAEGVAAGASWILNVTNDAWLSEASAWSRTSAFETHPAHLRLRAVESGLGAVRVANNGRTGVIDPLGRWTEALPPDLGGVARVRVRSAVETPGYPGWRGVWRWFWLLSGGIGLPFAGLLSARAAARSGWAVDRT